MTHVFAQRHLVISETSLFLCVIMKLELQHLRMFQIHVNSLNKLFLYFVSLITGLVVLIAQRIAIFFQRCINITIHSFSVNLLTTHFK